MIKNKIALIGSVVLFIICMCLFFPFPDHHMRGIRSTFMSFPIRNEEGYIPLGIIGSVLLIIAIVLLVISLAKYRFRTVVLSIIAYSFLPMALIIMYQETVANGIFSISYNGQGKCNFESVSKNVLSGECDFVLHNRSNKAVTFELEFLDHMEEEVQMTSLMNVAGPYTITIEGNSKNSIQFKELLDVSNVQNHIESGNSAYIHLKIIDEENTRIL